jgi:hypothetical protein
MSYPKVGENTLFRVSNSLQGLLTRRRNSGIHLALLFQQFLSPEIMEYKWYKF